MLRLKYLYAISETRNEERIDECSVAMSGTDSFFTKNFAQFSNYYIRSNAQLQDQLVEEGIYYTEERHIVLVALCGIVFEDSEAALNYLSSSCVLFSSELFLALFGWSGLTPAWAEKLYKAYPSESD